METEPSPSLAVLWTVRDVWLGAVLMGVWMAALLSAAAAIRVLALDVNAGLAVSLGELLLLLPVWWLAVRKYGVGWQALGLRRFEGTAVALGCGLMVFSTLFNAVYGLILAQFGLRAQADLVPLLSELSSPWYFWIGAVVVAPIVEEIFFRGFVFGGLRPHYGWKKAALISSALFAVIHLQPAAVVPIFLLGLVFALLYERSGSIWPAILMHVSSNALALGAAYLMMWAQANLPG